MGKLIYKLGSMFSKHPVGDLKHITDAIDNTLEMTSQDIAFLDLEYNIATSTGYCLDEWGSWFGVYRKIMESDASVRYRIMSKVVRPTTTIPALQLAVSGYYNEVLGSEIYQPSDIPILEPYTLLKTFSGKGGFSGRHRYPDDGLYRYNVIQITVPDNPTEELIRIINDTKACGIKVYYTVKQV
jgi:hypothetical protein